jgi:FAD dependent oxidoreductase TIGR03364
MAQQGFDVVIVGAGIVGLSHALAAARRGLSVAVVDRDRQANGASIRNFGFVTVTGQREGRTWRRARYSRDIWDRVAAPAGIPVLHPDLAVIARRPEAMTVLEQFAAGEMGAECALLSAAEMRARLPMAAPGALGGLWSPHERRVEPRTAIPALAAWLEAAHKVVFFRDTAVRGVESGAVDTAGGRIAARHVVVCPGPDLVTLFPDRLARRNLRLCKLQMLRLAAPGWTLPAAAMGDLSLVRYEGYAAQPAAAALGAVLAAEAGDALEHGIHLILVQSADGSLVVGDSHHYAATPDPFAAAEVENIILREARALLALPDGLPVIERWTGVYPSSAEETAFHDRVAPDILLSLVSSGTGMSTGFALGEEGIAALLGEPDPLEGTWS